jgi:hypothetical protein
MHPRYIFLISSALPLIIFVASFFLKERKIETNSGKDKSEEKNFEAEAMNTEIKDKYGINALEREIKDDVDKENLEKQLVGSSHNPDGKSNNPSFSMEKKEEISGASYVNEGSEKVNTLQGDRSNEKFKASKDVELNDMRSNTLNNSKHSRQISVRGKHVGEVFFQIEIENTEKRSKSNFHKHRKKRN